MRRLAAFAVLAFTITSTLAIGRRLLVTPDGGSLRFTTGGARPLVGAVDRLEPLSQLAVSYEDPRYSKADVVPECGGEEPTLSYPRPGRLFVSAKLDEAGRLPSTVAVLTELIGQNSKLHNAGEFELLMRLAHLVLVPVATKGSGRRSPLDARITLTDAERSMSETIAAIVKEVVRESGTAVGLGMMPLNLMSQRRVLIGATGEPARDVLLRCLRESRGRGRLSYRLLYDPALAKYFLNIRLAPREEHDLRAKVLSYLPCAGLATQCQVPTAGRPEVSKFYGFASAGGDQAEFRARLLGGSFVGREITEDPAGSATDAKDGCYFECAAFVRYDNSTAVSGGTWTVATGNAYGEDVVGFPDDVNDYYWRHHKTPCEMSAVQHVKIECDGVFCEYGMNLLRLLVREDGTVIGRGGATSAPPH